MSVIDAHVHVWDLDLGVHAWPDESVPTLHRTIGLDEVLPEFAAAGVSGGVLVQAADDALDTRHLLEVAARHLEVYGVVGWVPLRRPREAEVLLAEFTEHPAFVGVRALLHTYDDPEWILGAGDGLALLEQADVAFDFVTGGPGALAQLPTLSARHPELRLVLDHLGKPPLEGTADDRTAWRAAIARAARNPAVSAKLSGLYPAPGTPEPEAVERIRPFVADALELFGPDRLMYGGDWPVSVLAGGYSRGFTAIATLVDELAPTHRDAILGANAARIYRLPGVPE